VKYMAWAGFLEPATHVEMGGDWPQVCRACANTKWATVALVTWSLLAALLELRWLRLRLDPKRDTSGDKTIVCLWGSLAGLLATACMGSAFTHGCLDAVSTVGGVGRGAGLGPGLWCAAVSAILRGIGFILQLSLRAGAPTPPPDFQELPPRRGNARVDPRGVYQRVQSGAGKAMRRGYAMGNKVASHSSAAVWGAKSGSDGNGGGGNSSHRPEHLNQKEEEELRMDHGEAHNYQSFVEYYGCVKTLGSYPYGLLVHSLELASLLYLRVYCLDVVSANTFRFVSVSSLLHSFAALIILTLFQV